MTRVISVDPGKSSGACVLDVTSNGVDLVQGFQVGPGVNPFRELVTGLQEGYTTPDTIWIAEKFSPRPGQGFTHGLDSTIPLVCEGVLIDRDLLPEYTPGEKRWRAPILQYLMGGEGKAQKKSRTHAFLKANGFYRTGKDFGTADADDFRSAAAHGIAYLTREVKHRPTFEMVTGWGSDA